MDDFFTGKKIAIFLRGTTTRVISFDARYCDLCRLVVPDTPDSGNRIAT